MNRRVSAPPFAFPAFYQMPPSFTLQPVLITQKKQIQLWSELILSFCRHHQLHELNLIEYSKTPLFSNDKIKRSLSFDAIQLIIDSIVQQGNGEWIDKDHTRVLVLWRRVDEWAVMIYKWVVDSGQTDTVLTVWEIQNGDISSDQEFHKLDTKLLMRALRSLERAGKCQVFSAGGSTPGEDNMGVKFFAV